MQFGMVGRMGLGMRQVVGFGDRFIEIGNLGGKCGVPHCDQLGVCSVAVRKCVNRRSCGLVWCVGTGEALVMARHVPKFLCDLLLHSVVAIRSVCCRTWWGLPYAMFRKTTPLSINMMTFVLKITNFNFTCLHKSAVLDI